jgi:hypothetical protein
VTLIFHFLLNAKVGPLPFTFKKISCHHSTQDNHHQKNSPLAHKHSKHNTYNKKSDPTTISRPSRVPITYDNQKDDSTKLYIDLLRHSLQFMNRYLRVFQFKSDHFIYSHYIRKVCTKGERLLRCLPLTIMEDFLDLILALASRGEVGLNPSLEAAPLLLLLRLELVKGVVFLLPLSSMSTLHCDCLHFLE